MPKVKNKPKNIDPLIWAEVQRIRANARTPQAKAAAKLSRAAEKVKVKAKIERDKQPKDKVQPIRGRG